MRALVFFCASTQKLWILFIFMVVAAQKSQDSLLNDVLKIVFCSSTLFCSDGNQVRGLCPRDPQTSGLSFLSAIPGRLSVFIIEGNNFVFIGFVANTPHQ